VHLYEADSRVITSKIDKFSGAKFNCQVTNYFVTGITTFKLIMHDYS